MTRIIRLLVGEEDNYTLISSPCTPPQWAYPWDFFNIARSQSVVQLNHSRAQTSRLYQNFTFHGPVDQGLNKQSSSLEPFQGKPQKGDLGAKNYMLHTRECKLLAIHVYGDMPIIRELMHPVTIKLSLLAPKLKSYLLNSRMPIMIISCKLVTT